MPRVVGYDNIVTKQHTCPYCGAINEYTPDEVREIRTNYDYLGDYDLYRGFECAGCGNDIFVGKV